MLAPPLLAWFARARRDLPWRRDYDPYAVWIAEVMLQQTQVETMLPYYARWMARFPALADVARAPLADVLKHWEGLGYYARARNLHRAAQAVMERRQGRLPQKVEELMMLPGIGRYTAGAIASIAFNRPAPLVDGNVARVLCRVAALEEAPRSPTGKRVVWALAQAALPQESPRAFNEALMELGALVCRPRAPACPRCPLVAQCQARRLGTPEAYPRRPPRRERPVRRGVMLLGQTGARLLVRRRPPGGLWGGLWEFPWLELRSGESPHAALRRLAGPMGLSIDGKPQPCGRLIHGLTHFQLELACFAIRWKKFPPAAREDAARWVTPRELESLALGRLNHKALALLRKGGGMPPASAGATASRRRR
jgi:A/G-specific adenine glycosylase